jgi:two-component system, NtrC family, response regulator PilR
LIQALQATKGHRTAAANLLGLNLRQIRYRIARLNIAVPGTEVHEDDSTSHA